MWGCLCVPPESGSSASRFVLPLSLGHFSFKLSHYFRPPVIDEQEEHRFDTNYVYLVQVLREFLFLRQKFPGMSRMTNCAGVATRGSAYHPERAKG